MSAKRLTKAQVITEIAESSELDRKSVGRVFDSLTELIKKELLATYATISEEDLSIFVVVDSVDEAFACIEQNVHC